MTISSKILASYLAENQDSINVSNSFLRRNNGHWQDALRCHGVTAVPLRTGHGQQELHSEPSFAQTHMEGQTQSI